MLLEGAPTLLGVPVDGARIEELSKEELGRLEGCFAFARRDRDGSLVMGRDRTAMIPLYFDPEARRASVTAQELLSGSRALDARGLATFVVTSHMPAPLTIWRGVRRCPAGSVCTVTDAGLERQRLGRALPRTRAEAARMLLARDAAPGGVAALADGRLPSPGDESALEAWAAATLVAELRRSMAGCGQILLSGGLDSTILAFLARGEGTLRAFTFGAEPQDPWSDGPQRAAPVAARLGCRHEHWVVTPGEYLDSLHDYLGALSEPALASYLPYLISRKLRGQGRFIFGMGADEAFFGDPWYAKFVKARRVAEAMAWLPRPARRAVAAALRPLTPRIGGLAKKLDLVTCPRPDFRFLYAYARDNLDVTERLSLLAPAWRPPGFSRDDANFSRGDPFATGLEAIQEMLLVHEFADGHAQDLAYFHRDLDLTLPFLSDAAVAAALVVRPETRAIPGKWFLRESVRGLVPEDLLRARKGSFVMPAVAWLRGALAETLSDRLATTRLKRRGIWNVPEVERRLQAFRNGHGSPFDVMRVLHLELWMDRHGVEAAAP